MWATTFARMRIAKRGGRFCFVFIDVDCEDPPEMISSSWEKYEQGNDIVYGERVDRHESKAMKRARKFFLIGCSRGSR